MCIRDRIASKAHRLNVIDVQEYDKAVRLFEKTVKAVSYTHLDVYKRQKQKQGVC